MLTLQKVVKGKKGLLYSTMLTLKKALKRKQGFFSTMLTFKKALKGKNWDPDEIPMEEYLSWESSQPGFKIRWFGKALKGFTILC